MCWSYNEMNALEWAHYVHANRHPNHLSDETRQRMGIQLAEESPHWLKYPTRSLRMGLN